MRITKFLEGDVPRCATISFDEPDFSAKFDPHKRVWPASWKWANSLTPAELKNRVPKYAVPDHARYEYKRELQLWLDNGWLLPCPENELDSSMAGITNTSCHGLGMCSPLDFRHPNWLGIHKYKSIR